MTVKVMVVCLEKGSIKVSTVDRDGKDMVVHILDHGEHVDLYVYKEQQIKVVEQEV